MNQKLRNGTIIEGSDKQERFLSALYGSAIGRLILKPLTAPAVSKAAGAFLSTRFSCMLIKPFIRSNHIDMTQFADEKYDSYNAFFSRRIKGGMRPTDMDPCHLISPCDSKLTVLPITADGHFTIKQTRYSVNSLLKDPGLASKYIGGQLLIFRLTVDDYHRYCYAADGIPEEPVKIPGILHTVNPVANDFFPIYKENAREFTRLRTKEFGNILIMEVGALLVGKIVNHPAISRVKRGQEKGYFQFGGSTVIMMLKKDVALIDTDILENSENGYETVVKMGEKIGVALPSAK